MGPISSWLETEFLRTAKSVNPFWAVAETAHFRAFLYCESMIVHDGEKATQCSPGTIEAEMRLEILQENEQPVTNTQFIFLGRLSPEELNRAVPSSDVVEKLMKDLNKRYSKALLSCLNRMERKRIRPYELMPHDLLVRQSPARLLAKLL